MTRFITTIAFVLLGFLIPLPARAALRVVTATTDLADIVQSIGGEQVTVESICAGNQDPHYVQPRPSYIVKLSRADLVVSVGLELEIGWLPKLIDGSRNPKVRPGQAGFLDASSAITAIEVNSDADRSAGDVHRLGNPHYWLDALNVQRVAKLIGERLGQLDPKNQAAYATRTSSFVSGIDGAMQRWNAALAPYRGSRVVSYHRTFNYFLQRFGLEAVGYVEERPGIPPGPSHLARLIQLMRSSNTRVILHEQYFDTKASDMVASKTGARVLVLPTSVDGVPQASNYERLMDHLVQSLLSALKGSG